MATKKTNRAKVRAYVFSNPTGDTLAVVVARSKDEAMARHVKDGGNENSGVEAIAVRFAY